MHDEKMSGARVKRIRKSLGLSTRKFAKVVHVAAMSIYRWEFNQAPVSPANIPVLEALERLPVKGNVDPELWDRVLAGQRVGGDARWLARLFKVAFEPEDGNREKEGFVLEPIRLKGKKAPGRRSLPPELRMMEHRLAMHLMYSDEEFEDVLEGYQAAFEEVMARLRTLQKEKQDWMDRKTDTYKDIVIKTKPGKKTKKKRGKRAKKKS